MYFHFYITRYEYYDNVKLETHNVLGVDELHTNTGTHTNTFNNTSVHNIKPICY